jgi:hypothetical protein
VQRAPVVDPRDRSTPGAQAALADVRKAVLDGRYIDADAAAKRLMGPFTESYLPLGDLFLVHGHYLQDWLLESTDFSWRLEPEKWGESSAVGDIGAHWCDLVQHVTGLRILEVLADLTTVVGTRLKPRKWRLIKGRARPRGTGVIAGGQRLRPDQLEGGLRGSLVVSQVARGARTGSGSKWTGVSALVGSGGIEPPVDRSPRQTEGR